jgi:hypothetical protein
VELDHQRTCAGATTATTATATATTAVAAVAPHVPNQVVSAMCFAALPEHVPLKQTRRQQAWWMWCTHA